MLAPAAAAASIAAVPAPLLLPAPRSWIPGSGACADPARVAVHRSAHPPQAYRLELAADRVRIDCGDDAGERHARATLAQLVAQGAPCGVIEDAPAFAHRGVMLDISRDRVPTPATLRGLVVGKTTDFLYDLLFDPQTSGGLLIAVHPDDMETFSALAGAAGVSHWVIGQFRDSPKGKILLS